MASKKAAFGAGLDVGTMNLLSARKDVDGKVVIKKMRDAFLDIDAEHKQFLKLSDVNYIEQDDKLLIVGDEALPVANMMRREVRRPMKDGVISSAEMDSYGVLSLMIEQLLGKPRTENEICYFSVPAAPIDKPGQDVIFHQGVFKRLIGQLGYDAKPFNEAAAICYSEAAGEGFSALTMSFGAGMVNVALTYKTMSSMQFSLARSGDWIDTQVAIATNKTASKVISIKEKEADLMDYKQGKAKNLRTREALMVYYKALIEYTLDNVVKEFKKAGDIDLPDDIPLIVSGGTSMAKNFVPFFKQTFDSYAEFPIDISEVRHAKDPLGAVAKGLLVNASIHY